MKVNCNIIRDLLPLYADDACSEASRNLVEEHLAECQDCSCMLRRLRNDEIESGLQKEKQDVIEYGERRFKRRSATVGSTVSGMFMIPILVCLIINLTAGSAMGWFLIVLAAMAVAASVIIVPIMVPKDKLFWTFCAFTASLMILLGVTCLVSRGDWFWVAASAVLFGLSVFFLPFVIRARPLQNLLGNRNKALIVVGVDLLLFLNMMNIIRIHGQGGIGFWPTAGIVAVITLAVLYRMRQNSEKK
jgi:predicted anti-sigma-YlaC factor YlaD